MTHQRRLGFQVAEVQSPVHVFHTLQPGDMVTIESRELPKPRKLIVTHVGDHNSIYVTSGHVRPGHRGGGRLHVHNDEVFYDATIQQRPVRVTKLTRTAAAMAEPREHTVADFTALDDLIAHARDELGATHVTVAGTKSKLYFPHIGEHPYEAASVRIKNGYWHADGPGARQGVRSLPASARPIGGGRQRAAEVRTEPTAELIEDFATDIAAFSRSSKITLDQAYDAISKPAWVRNFKGNMIDLENRIINKAKSIRRRDPHEPHVDPHNTVANSVRDYIAVDSRGRTIAGPFKSYGDAKHAAGLGGNVEYVRETGVAGVFEVDEGHGTTKPPVAAPRRRSKTRQKLTKRRKRDRHGRFL